MPFVKLDCGIIHSSLWAESSDTRICWITLLVMADATGFVRAAPSAIARQAGISAEAARNALELFASPDDESRSPENKGKRVERIEGGFCVLNYEKYRERDYTNATRQKRHRQKQKRNAVTPLRNAVTPVTDRYVTLPVTHADADKEKEPPNPLKGEERKEPLIAEQIYWAYPRHEEKPEALRAINKAIARGADPVELLAKTVAYAKTRPPRSQFTPMPATWFNRERYKDDPEEWVREDDTAANKPKPLKPWQKF